MTPSKEITTLINTCASCESACIANATESAAASGQERVSKRSTECAGECRELRQQLAKNPKASTGRFQAACEACVAECERGGLISPIRKKCIETCKSAIKACEAATKISLM